MGSNEELKEIVIGSGDTRPPLGKHVRRRSSSEWKVKSPHQKVKTAEEKGMDRPLLQHASSEPSNRLEVTLLLVDGNWGP
jgi:hypothetical protein